MSGGALLLTAVAALAQVELPGTQPNELSAPPEPSSTCSCHDGYDPVSSVEPGESYRATAMSVAARDPLFRAAFEVARRDRPDLTDLCLRCHAPVAWLNGRSEGDLSQLIESDLESVSCDVCHRMERNEPYIGSGQFKIDTQTRKRSRRGAEPFGGHGVLRTSFVASAEMCGACHSLFSPVENAHGALGVEFPFPYYEQRTYEEWKDSRAFRDNVTCIDCHMKKARGRGAEGGDVYDDLAVHSFVGGNAFVVDAVRILYPELRLNEEASQVKAWIRASLQSAAELTTTTGPIDVRSGQSFPVQVRLTNKTGHKLPSGYPEGRRVYLAVELTLAGRAPEMLTGAWDEARGVLVSDPQLRTYETEHGRYENGMSIRTRRLLLMNQVLSDTRLPPEGFTPSFPDMVPVGRDYGPGPEFRHWDDVAYRFTAPEVSAPTPGTLVVRAMYQATDGDVVRFLMSAAAGTEAAADLERVWDRLGHDLPREMVSVAIPVTVRPGRSTPDGGRPIGPGAGERRGSGGGCLAAGGFRTSWVPVLLLVLLFVRGFRARCRPLRSGPGSVAEVGRSHDARFERGRAILQPRRIRQNGAR